MNISLSEVAKQINTANTGGEPAENEFGEKALPLAPTIAASDGRQVVPQQFLDVNRSLQSVEQILSKLTLPEHYLLFAGVENDLVFLVCGVIGHENYIKRPEQRHEQKIVYGRRWLLEPTTPTSEVIQTALLAVKKAKEHELRERVRYRLSDTNKRQSRSTTPFNCHMDLPLMAVSDLGANSKGRSEHNSWCIESELERLTVDGLQPKRLETHNLGGKRQLIDIRLQRNKSVPSSFAELDGEIVSVLCERGTRSEFLHQFFNALLDRCDRFVESVFKFDGFARFEQSLCPSHIAEFSYRTRNVVQQDPNFNVHFQDMSYRVDSAKAPTINAGKLGQQQRQILQTIRDQHGELAGYLPHGL